MEEGEAHKGWSRFLSVPGSLERCWVKACTHTCTHKEDKRHILQNRSLSCCKEPDSPKGTLKRRQLSEPCWLRKWSSMSWMGWTFAALAPA